MKIEEFTTEGMKFSDLPPTMRRPLTMKDIEAERPKGPYRYRVGNMRFMNLKAAQEHAANTGQKVQSLDGDSGKTVPSPRSESKTHQSIKKPKVAEDLAWSQDFDPGKSLLNQIQKQP